MDFHTIPGEDQTFICSQEGEGPDAVLVHGFPDTPHSFAAVQAAFAGGGWRVSVPWLRGYHPNTIVPGRRYDPETLGRDVLDLLDAIGASRALLVGHDWGALSAYAAAALAPERVAGIVAIAVPHPSTLSRTPAALWAVRHFFLLKACVAAARVLRLGRRQRQGPTPAQCAPVAQWSTVLFGEPKSSGLSSRRPRVRFPPGALQEVPANEPV